MGWRAKMKLSEENDTFVEPVSTLEVLTKCLPL